VGSLAILRLGQQPVGELARRSNVWDLPAPADARLVVGIPNARSGEALVLGAFQRSSEMASTETRPLLRRGSGGASAVVGPGTVWIQLVLARPDALVAACTPEKLLNRHVRPLLRAITRVASIPASYFGRDWVSVAHRPAALVAFGHDAATARCLFEAIVAVSTPFAPSVRPSFLGKEPATLEEIAGRPIDAVAVADAIASAYRGIASDVHELELPAPARTSELPVVESEPEWRARREEAIGTVAAGRDASGRLRVGGELMASRDAIARLEDLVAALPPDASPDDVGRAVDEALTTRGAITFGVRSLTSIRDVILDAQKPEP
jgi:hypothetical protein